MVNHLGLALKIPTLPKPGINQYFLRVNFNTDDAAPVASPYAGETGSIVVSDSSNRYGVASGRLTSSGASVGTSNPYMRSAALTRQNGLLGVIDHKQNLIGTDSLKNVSPALGFGVSTTHAFTTQYGVAYGVGNNGSFLACINAGSSTPTSFINDVLGQEFRFAFLALGSLIYSMVRGKIVFIAEGVSAGSLYLGVSDIGANRYSQDIGYIAAGLLRGQYAQDHALRVLDIASPIVGQTFTHPTSLFGFVTITTVPSSGNIDIVIRKQDVNNKLIFRVTSTGRLQNITVVAGSETVSSETETGFITNGTRVYLLLDGTTVGAGKTSPAIANGPINIPNNNFLTATAGEISSLGTGGAIADLHIHYRDIPSSLQTEINAS